MQARNINARLRVPLNVSDCCNEWPFCDLLQTTNLSSCTSPSDNNYSFSGTYIPPKVPSAGLTTMTRVRNIASGNGEERLFGNHPAWHHLC